MWNRPVKKYVDQGYFCSGSYWCGVYITIKGRMWMHQNASMGWLDSILDREALISRLSPAMDLPLAPPLNFESKLR
jgi:hypothetical protein